MKRTVLFTLILLVVHQGVRAQQALPGGQALPGAGSQLEQLPRVPVPQQAAPNIRIEEAPAQSAPDSGSVRVTVAALHITGAHVFPEDKLVAVAGFKPGEKLSLADLQAMASRITEFYHQHGYFVAQAFLPAQKVVDNSVTMAVSEGRYGKIVLHNSTNLSNSLAQDKLDGLNEGGPITVAPLESHLLLLSDVPGVDVSSTLTPGAEPGSSDLTVNVTPGQRVTGSVYADNAGNPYTGEYRGGATVNVNDPFGRGDVASVSALTSGRGLRYGLVSYQTQFGLATVGASYSKLDYQLGDQFRALDAHGTAGVASVYGSYPLVRSRDTNLTVGLVVEDETLRDDIDLFHYVSDRKVRVAAAQLYGNHQDNFAGGGSTSFFVSVSGGSVDIRSPEARAFDNAGAQTGGPYGKLWFDVTRLQHVTDVVSLYGSFTGQIASKNLDPSEQMVLGGMDGVRAYPQGEGYGDDGYIASLEARFLIAGLSRYVPGQVHLLGFVDNGYVKFNEHPWYPGDNSRTLSSVGVGASWEDPGDFLVRMYYAHKLGSDAALSAPDKSGRFWVQLVKYF